MNATWIFLLINVGLPLMKHILEEAPTGPVKEKLSKIVHMIESVINEVSHGPHKTSS